MGGRFVAMRALWCVLGAGAVLGWLQGTTAAAQTVNDSIQVQLLAEGLAAPIDLKQPADNSGRLFVLDQSGLIHVLAADGGLHAEPLLDLRPSLIKLEADFEERGLLGLAVHPGFADNGQLYVSYSAPLRADSPRAWNYTRRISEFTVTKDRPGTIDLATERVLLELDWPSRKHNGGGLAFGPDGYLYIGLGDGGGVHGIGKKVLYDAFAVPESNIHWDALAQDVSTLYGKILRLDVDHGYPGYGIPSYNPFVGKPGRDEIYAWGFRNPYRIAVDEPSGTMLISATAETLWESIYLLDQPGNYGWALKEGTHCFKRLQPLTPSVDCARYGPQGFLIRNPVVEYTNMKIAFVGGNPQRGMGTAVVGGQIYRGKAMPEFYGKLVFADWSADFKQPSGQLFVATQASQLGALWSITKLMELPTRILSIAQDAAGELYLLTGDELGPFGKTGKVYKLTAAPQ